MEFYNSLLEKYGYNEPIFLNEIKYKNYSLPWVYKELDKLCQYNKLIRYEKGIYYIPMQTPLGLSVLNPRKVIEKKYICKDGDTIGYYAGATFYNQLGMSSQMANTIEIYTNKEKAQTRSILIGHQKVVLRKSRTTIDQTNVAVLSFLELMNRVSATFFNEYRKEILQRFISDTGITRDAITKYAPFFPDRAMRTLVESEVIYSVTQ